MKRISIDVDKKPIEDLIPDLESGKYLLPSFQRQYIWGEDDIKYLIDSIINNYPIGTVILWKPSNTSASQIDPFSRPLLDLNERKHSEIFYVIDGQQRLTSLLLLFNNWKISRGKEIKCEIPISYNPTNKKFYKSKTQGKDLSELIKAFWLKDMDVLIELKNNTPKNYFEDMKEKIDRILKYKLPIYVMETYEENEETFQDMAEAFIRVNRYGVRIGNLELMLSFLAGAISGDLKDKVYKLYEPLYDVFEIELQPVIRFAFSNFDLKQTQISKVNQFRANIKKILSLAPTKINAIFGDCQTSMNLTVDLLKKEIGISNSGLLPSQIPLVTISSYFFQKNVKKTEELNEKDIKSIINWFILASFNGYYSSATDTKLDEDLNEVKSYPYFPFDELIENMEKRKAKIKIAESDIKRGRTINVLRREGRAHLFILYIILTKKNVDNWNGKLLSQSPLTELARHHIFPKEFLETQLKIDDPDDREILINNFANVTFIHKDINSEIGDNSPETYMNGYIQSAKNHFIPTDKTLWELDQYQTFLDYRIKEVYRAGKDMFKEIFE
ncbi:MAG TPA: GmrSD restriction endonuclease domain-containing protein [Candidatus Brocadiia bacterium]|nr:DUF262 domain-containing protein [Candidatus Brocadiales bacterium]